MAEDLKKMYRTIMEDHFPDSLCIRFGDQELKYRKRSWKFPDPKTGELIEKGLRYGENPGQEAALYELIGGNLTLGDCRFIDPNSGLVSAIREEDMLQEGKHPGKTNLTDLDNGLNILKYLMGKPAAVILKHNNPCGAAYGKTLADAYYRANRADRIAAFGGCLVLNRPLDKETAELVSQNYLEVVAAPDYEEGALDLLKKRANLRIIQVRKIDRLTDFLSRRFVDFKSLIDGGLIVQQSPLNRVLEAKDLKLAETVSSGKTYKIRREPTPGEMEDLLFGWFIEQGVTSNSVLYVKDGCTVGIGTGEQDRVGVAEIAVYKAYQKYADALCHERYQMSYKELELAIEKGNRPREQQEEIDAETRAVNGGLKGAAMVSDAFFPFRDGVDVGLRQGISAVVQPGGSMRDWEVIEACNEANATMVFTGQRAFKH
ncbi:IMP cyclohydrolase [Desulforhabdus amnigena]|jgi:phosphoribosylaminoimidazolecarboxamide formyltransferase/IMP cyclohydrolase|uniref:Phosphoribosylaminoimidazolecarboxamide formyltransferase n=1 Tax=Desulforhabdus amnigena TaxID=40218 RepID=A0A9W6FVW4_9BACT|nr:IMP cyclohydrolase [Desulforhabdus amnigena]NLJ26491.1 IMP cyclohydrolase [Deltaproteobacteria bacterium]GLI35860.1 phosphoribosylaminoimidazolecarboxamide formyltransferase [Desulforhabdus amnigena]